MNRWKGEFIAGIGVIYTLFGLVFIQGISSDYSGITA